MTSISFSGASLITETLSLFSKVEGILLKGLVGLAGVEAARGGGECKEGEGGGIFHKSA